MAMTLDHGLAFFAFAMVAAVTPGPSNVMITATGSAAGIRRGLPCVFGAASGMASLLFISGLGLGQIMLAYPLLLTVMKWCGAVLLLWLAWKIATAGRTSETGAARPVGFWGAAAFQWLNPKGWLVAVSAAGVYTLAADRPVIEALILGGLFFLAAFPSGLIWLVLGTVMGRLLHDEKRARIFNIVMGAALAGSVAMILV
jgi:threonine/homoserine/homoserine lactone efflux protein